MSLIDVPAKKTPMSGDDAAKALAAAYRSVVGKLPSASILGLLVGQWAVETAKGNSIYNYNFGNTMPTSSDKYRQLLHASEVINGVNVPMDEWFAAYTTAKEGARRYIEVLKSRAHWWNGLQSGNQDAFVKGLSTAPVYFTANPNTYLVALKKHIITFDASIKKYSSSLLGNIFEIIAGLTLAGSSIYAYKRLRKWH